MGPFEVEAKHIERLDPLQLTRLLKRLLYLEATEVGIPLSAPHVPLDINVPDGGIDGYIKWENGVEKTDFLPNRFTSFQSKAKGIKPKECYNEMLIKGQTKLKEQVAKVLNTGGSYIIFCGKGYNPRQINERLKKMRMALKTAERSGYENERINFYDGNKIAGWVNKYFAAQIDVRSCVGQAVPIGLKTWEDWARHDDFAQEYVCNDKLKEYKEVLKKEFLSPGKSIVRVTGLSGLGKTRLALEVFRGENNAISILRSIVLYFDAAGGDEGLVRFIADSRNNDLRAILIVDNCDSGLHVRLSQEMGYGRHNIKLITIDYDLSEVNFRTKPIQITQKDCQGVVRGILKKTYIGLGEPIISRIEEFARDFPSIAVLLAKQVKEGVSDIGRLSDPQLAKKLLWGREIEDENVIQVIKSCSLFNYVEFSEDEYTNEVKFLCEEVAHVSEKAFFEICIRYLKSGVLQKRGRFIRVSPIPLAIKLAAEWWEATPLNEIVRFTEKLNEIGLLERFCEQAKMLHFSKKAREVVEKLYGPQGPFGDQEKLLSNEGSRLFLALVEVNPQITMEALWVAIWGKSREELLEIRDDVRRNLVCALEKLCWWEETFEKAARLLLKLGAAENESWGNNATQQFEHLFKIRLPGTQANLNDRLSVAREALDSGVEDERELGILALGKAIEADSFSRDAGVESQGSRVPGKDYKPTGQEIRQYWQECIDLLKGVIVQGGELSSLARQELGTKIRGLLRNGMIDEIDATLKDVVKEKGTYWPEALKSLRDCLDYDEVNMPKEVRERISSLAKILEPENLGLGEKLRLTVSVPDWRHRKDEKGEYVSVAEEEAGELAHRIADNSSWFENVRVVLEGEQRQAYAFGRALGQCMRVELRREFVEVCLRILAELGRENANPDVLGAFLGSVSDGTLINETMDRIVNDDKLCVYVVWITRFLDLTEKRLSKLLLLVKQAKIPVSDLRVLSYGRALDKFSEDFVSEFCQEIAQHGQEGANCAIDILSMYCHQKDERFRKCAHAFKDIIMKKRLLIGKKPSQMAQHFWEIASKKLLRINRDVELAKHLTDEIVQMCGSDEVAWHNIHSSAKTVIEILLKEYFNECWDTVGKALISNDWSTKHYLGEIVGLRYEKEKSEALITEISQEGLFEWCKKNIPHGPAAIANLTPIFSSDTERQSLHPLAQRLIDDFGDIEAVRNEFSSSLFSFPSCGSRAPYYQRRINLLKELTAHPIKEIRGWAKSNIKWLEKERDEEARESEEREWGVIR